MAYFQNGRSTTSYLGNLFWSKNKVQIFFWGGLEAKMMCWWGIMPGRSFLV